MTDDDRPAEVCTTCGKPVITMCQRGTGFCGQKCARAAGVEPGKTANARSASNEEEAAA